jgi:hypothetical protein
MMDVRLSFKSKAPRPQAYGVLRSFCLPLDLDLDLDFGAAVGFTKGFAGGIAFAFAFAFVFVAAGGR